MLTSLNRMHQNTPLACEIRAPRVAEEARRAQWKWSQGKQHHSPADRRPSHVHGARQPTGIKHSPMCMFRLSANNASCVQYISSPTNARPPSRHHHNPSTASREQHTSRGPHRRRRYERLCARCSCCGEQHQQCAGIGGGDSHTDSLFVRFRLIATNTSGSSPAMPNSALEGALACAVGLLFLHTPDLGVPCV